MSNRKELYSKLGISPPVVAPILEACYELEAEQIWEEDLFSSPHGHPWHTSFHASSFPGDSEQACGRAAMYTMANVPQPKPFDWKVTLMGEQGKSLEESIVWRFDRAGLLLSNPPSAEFQTGFTDKEHWLTCAPDCIIQLPSNNKPYVIEIKGKDPHVIEAMKSGQRSYDPAHRNQLLTQLAFTHKHSKELWPDLEQCNQGCILYVDRARPANTHEFKFNVNMDFFNEGLQRLEEWQESFIKKQLPPRDPDWKWSEGVCKYCPFKKEACKPDVKEGVTDLTKSNGIKWATEVYSDPYTFDAAYARVLDRWDSKGVNS